MDKAKPQGSVPVRRQGKGLLEGECKKKEFLSILELGMQGCLGRAGQTEPALPTNRGCSGDEPWDKGCPRTTSARGEGGPKCHSPQALLADAGLQEELRERTDTYLKKKEKKVYLGLHPLLPPRPKCPGSARAQLFQD